MVSKIEAQSCRSHPEKRKKERKPHHEDLLQEMDARLGWDGTGLPTTGVILLGVGADGRVR